MTRATSSALPRVRCHGAPSSPLRLTGSRTRSCSSTRTAATGFAILHSKGYPPVFLHLAHASEIREALLGAWLGHTSTGVAAGTSSVTASSPESGQCDRVTRLGPSSPRRFAPEVRHYGSRYVLRAPEVGALASGSRHGPGSCRRADRSATRRPRHRRRLGPGRRPDRADAVPEPAGPMHSLIEVTRVTRFLCRHRTAEGCAECRPGGLRPGAARPTTARARAALLRPPARPRLGRG